MRNLYNQTKIATEMSDLKTNQDTCKMYLVLDAALWSVEIEPAFEFGNKYCCLFATKGAEDELNDVAPYLFEYEESDELSKWVKYKEAKDKRALYLVSSLSLEQLRKHLRKFLRVKTEEGKWLFFRLHDPFVINYVLPNLTQVQLEELFESIRYIITNDIRINEQRIFYLSSDRELKIKSQTLEEICG